MTAAPALTAERLIAWSDATSQRWRELVETHPALLAVPCDIRGAATVADLLLHIGAAELRYAEQLDRHAPTPYEQLSSATPESIFAPHAAGIAIYRRLLSQPDYPWQESFAVTTRSAGVLHASREDVFLHALLHGIRHYAQLATLARHAGYPPGWPMDYIFLRADRT